MCSQNQLCILICFENLELGTCRHFFSHENNTVIEKSKLVSTRVDIKNLEERLQKVYIVDTCTR